MCHPHPLSSALCFVVLAGTPLRMVAQEPAPVTPTTDPPAAAPAMVPARGEDPRIALVHDAGEGLLIECVVSANGTTSVAMTGDGFLHFRKLAPWLKGDEKQQGAADKRFAYDADLLQLTADGERLIGRIRPDTLAILTSKPRVLHHLRGLPGVNCLAQRPGGKHLATAIQGGMVRLLDLETGKPEQYWPANQKPATWIGFTPDGDTLLVANTDKQVVCMSYPHGNKTREFLLPSTIDHAVVATAAKGPRLFAPIGKTAYGVGVVSGTIEKRFEFEADLLRMAIDAASKTIGVALADGRVCLVDAESGARQHVWMAHPDQRILALEFVTPEGSSPLLMTAAEGGDIVFWKLAALAAASPPAGEAKPEAKPRGRAKPEGKTKPRGGKSGR